MDVTPYSIASFITGALAVFIALVAWKRKKVVGGLLLALLMAAVAIWALGASIEYASVGIPSKVFWSKIEYFGVVSPVLYLLLALEFNRLERLLTARNVALLFIIPLITLGLALTNEWHHLIWSSFTPGPAGTNLLIYGHGPGFWIGAVGYSYLAMFSGSILMIAAVIRFPTIYRRQAAAILAAGISPWLASLVYISGLSPLPGLELTPLVLVFAGGILALTIFRFKFLDLVPMARDSQIEKMPDGMIVLDELERIVDINPAAHQLLQTGSAIQAGQPIRDVLDPWPEALTQVKGQSDRRIEITLDGGEANFVELTFSPVRDRQGRIAGQLITIHDTHLRKQAEIAMQRRDAILQAVSTVADKFLKAGSWEDSMQKVLEQIGRAAIVSRVYIFERLINDEGEPHVNQRYEWVEEGIEPQMDNPALQDLPFGSGGFEEWDDRLADRHYISGHVREFPEFIREHLAAQSILSLAVVPVFAGEFFWGFMGFDDCRKERLWSEVEIKALQIAADILGSALVLQKHQRALDSLNKIVSAALQASDLQQMSQALVDQLAGMIGADGCFLTLWDESTHCTIPQAAYGPFRDTYREMVLQQDERTITASVLEAGHSLVVEDAYRSPHVSSRIARHFPSRSLLGMPLVVDGRKLGALLLAFDHFHQFSQEEISVSEEAANLIALTLSKFQAMEQANQQAEESETLRKAGAAIAETLNSDEALGRILEQLEKVVPCDTASVQLLRDRYLEIIGGRGWSDMAAVIGMRFRYPGQNPNTVVIQSRHPYILGDARTAYELFHQSEFSHIRSWLGVPLIVHSKVIGLLEIDASQPNHFTEAHVRVASAFADHVAIWLENARLFNEVQALVLIDPLTNLYNRRGLFTIGQVELNQAERHKRHFSVLMLDIDHFKLINDRFGHVEGGDPVLKELASVCKASIREIDIVGRYGGEEFVILLPETDLDSALLVAERVRKKIALMEVVSKKGNINITVSIGVATYTEGVHDLDELIASADKALYQAKNEGRNRVTIFQQ
jgi:diguanylate cyclase (GGDEF)-like protein/PAS domain S-box-containing protein